MPATIVTQRGAGNSARRVVAGNGDHVDTVHRDIDAGDVSEPGAGLMEHWHHVVAETEFGEQRLTPSMRAGIEKLAWCSRW